MNLEIPEFCYVPLRAELEVGIAKRFETGYYKTDFGQVARNQKELEEHVNAKNKLAGISKSQAMAFESCSMFDSWGNYEKILKIYQKRIPE